MRHNIVTALATATLAATCTVLATVGTAHADPATRLHEGMQVVGQDVAPGTYSTPGPRDQDYGYCFITWLPYKGAKDSEATDIQSYSGASYVRLKAGDVITVEGCVWTLE